MRQKKIKMTDQEIWQAPLIFIFPSLEWYQPPAASSQRAAIWEATWDACQLTRYTFNPYFFFSSPLSFLSLLNFQPFLQYAFLFSRNFHPADLSLCSLLEHRHMIAPHCPTSSARSRWRVARLLCSLFLSPVAIRTVNARAEDLLRAALCWWQVTSW